MSETTPISKSEPMVAWMPVSAAAVELKVTPQRVYQLIDEGLVRGIKVGKTWFVSCRSVQARITMLRSEVKMSIVERPRGMNTKGV